MTELPYVVGKRDRDGKMLEAAVRPVRRKSLGIVGNCPHCGAPVYGGKQLSGELKERLRHSEWLFGEPEIRYSCECRKEYRKEKE